MLPFTLDIHAEASKAGVVIYHDPLDLDPSKVCVDPLIWPAIEKINKSGWVWTAESCRGHPDCTEERPWGFNSRPMLRLFCKTPDVGRLFAALMQASKYDKDGLEGRTSYELHPRCLGDWFEVLVYIWGVNNVYHRNQGIAAYERFGELVVCHITDSENLVQDA